MLGRSLVLLKLLQRVSGKPAAVKPTVFKKSRLEVSFMSSPSNLNAKYAEQSQSAQEN
jgi:hypothetical protein